MSVDTDDILIEVETITDESGLIDKFVSGINQFFNKHNFGNSDTRSWSEILKDSKKLQIQENTNKGINFKTFEKMLEKIKMSLESLQTSVNSYIQNNPFIEDSKGIVHQNLLNLIQDQFNILVIAALGNQYDASNKKHVYAVQDFVEYFLWEEDFGGEITVDDKVFKLSNTEQLYMYIQNNLLI